MSRLQFAFTLDYDWASEAVMEYSLRQLVEAKVPITLFATHNSIYVNNYAKARGDIEVEIHPNFCLNSSHGRNYAEVFAHCDNIVSDGKGFRCHRFFCSNDIYEHYKRQGKLFASNICTDLEYVKPFRNRVGLLEIPIYMEDGGFLFQRHSLDMETVMANIPSCRNSEDNVTIVFLFHPMHIALNSCNFETMRQIKQSLSIEEYQNIDFDFIKQKRGVKYGINDILDDLYNWSEQNGVPKVLLSDVLYDK